MTKAVIFDERDGSIVKCYNTLRGAKGAFTRTGMCDDENLTCCTIEHYAKTGAVKAVSPVVVYSIFDLKKERPITIALIDKGGPCDPSTERYHSM